MDSELRAELTTPQSEWLQHLRSWERSGLSLKAYAQREGLDHRRLYRFRRLLTDKGVYREGEALSRRFVRAHVAPEREQVGLCRIRLANGCVVEFGVELRGACLHAELPKATTVEDIEALLRTLQNLTVKIAMAPTTIIESE